MTPYLHGVDVVERTTGTRPVRAVRTAVVGLVGTAPLWAVAAGDQKINTPVLIASRADAAKYFGPEKAGYTIPAALRAIFAAGRGPVIVVNVFDPATHKTAVVSAPYVFGADGTIQLPHEGIAAVVVKSQDNATTHAVGDDYTIDLVTGLLTRVADGAIAAGATVNVAYDRPNPAGVLNDDVVGEEGVGGIRTGAQAWLDARTGIGFGPKILIAPGYSTQDAVADALEALAPQLRAIALVDAPAGTTVADAIAGRGAAGAINFNRISERVGLCYPYVKARDADGAEVVEPFSSHIAGVMAARDETNGFWWSVSNAVLPGVIGLERPITFAYSDSNSEANRLNEQGIITAVNVDGVFRVWGNRSAAWPSDAHPRNFIAVRRVADQLEEAVEQAVIPFIDQPITRALLDSITGSVNAYIRTLVGQGALVGGECLYDDARNPAEEVAAGHLTFSLSFMPPVPAERITMETFIDTALLGAVSSAA